jgi:hypothetical protein
VSTLRAIHTKFMVPTVLEFIGLLEGKSLSLDDILALRRQLHAPFRLHPLGFISCILLSDGPKKIRLHYWPLSGGEQQSPGCQIHDHLFEFKSWVFAGQVQNIEYTISDSGKQLAEYRTMYDGDHSILLKTGRTTRLVESRRSTYGPGSTYILSAGVLHETIRLGAEAAFTVLAATDTKNVRPLVLGPLDGEARYLYKRELLDDSVAERLIAGA